MSGSHEHTQPLPYHFAHLQGLTAQQQAEYLNALDDLTLKGELEALLAVGDESDFATLIGGQVDNVTGDKAIEALSQTRVGPFELQGIIGRGGMGIVYDAKRIDGVFEQHVAIKFVYPSITALTGRETVFFEARCLGQLAHPNIVTIHDAGELSLGACYFVMEYLEGEALDAYSRRPETTTQDIIKRVIELCDALEATHRIHIVHSDIKPNNVVVNTEGRTKVLDFGIAHIMEGEKSIPTHSSLISKSTEGKAEDKEASNSNPPSSTSQTNTSSNIKGMTLAFASPEQQAHKKVTPLSDIYSVGALLRYVLSLNVHYKKLPKARQQELQRIADQCMQQNPDDRYQQVESIKRDLQNWLEGRRLSFELKVSLRTSSKWIKRNPWLSTLCVLILLSVPVALHYQTKLQNEQAQSQEVAKHFESFIRYTDPAIAGKPMSEAKQMLLDTYNNVANSTQLTLANKHHIVVTILDSLIGLGEYEQVLNYEKDDFFKTLLSIDSENDFALTRQLITAQIKQGSFTNAYQRYKKSLDSYPDMSLRSSLLLGLAAAVTMDDVLGDDGFKQWNDLNEQIIANADLFNEEELLDNTISISQRLYAELNRQIFITEERQKLDEQDIQIAYKKLKLAVEEIPVIHAEYVNVIRYLSHLGLLLNDETVYSDILLDSLDIIEQTYGEKHPIVIKLLWRIADVLHRYEQNLIDAYHFYQLAYQRAKAQEFFYDGRFARDAAWSLSYMGKHQESLKLLLTNFSKEVDELSWEDRYENKYDLVWQILEFFPDVAYEQVVILQQWLKSVPDSVDTSEFNLPAEQLFLAVLRTSLEGRFDESIALLIDNRHMIDGSNEWSEDALEEYLYRKQGRFNKSQQVLERLIPKFGDLGLYFQDGLYQDAYLWQAQGLAELGKPEEAAAVLQACFDFSYNLRAEPDNFWLQVVATMANYYNLPLDTHELTVPLMDNNFLLTGGKQRLMPPENEKNSDFE